MGHVSQKALHDNAFHLHDPGTQMFGTHYPYSRPVNTARQHGCQFVHP